MAQNYARRASDRRRAISKRGQPTAYIAGSAAVMLVKNELPRLRVVEKPLTLIPGVLVVGAHSPLMGGYACTYRGQSTWMTREEINGLLTVAHNLKALNRKLQPRVARAKAPTTPLLSAWCATSQKSTMPTLAAAA